jgi:hypothetical protein
MRISRAVAVVALAGASVWANEKKPAMDRKVEVCVAMDHDFVVQRAESIAAGMFGEIGIAIEWHSNRSCPLDAIHISFSDHTDRKFLPEAVAYALPYEGSHIQVFSERLRQHGPRRLPVVLAHVMVHEITHILQGVPRHSESGIMKPRWSNNDYTEMMYKPLPFAPEDVKLVQLGLDAREFRVIAVNLQKHP